MQRPLRRAVFLVLLTLGVLLLLAWLMTRPAAAQGGTPGGAAQPYSFTVVLPGVQQGRPLRGAQVDVVDAGGATMNRLDGTLVQGVRLRGYTRAVEVAQGGRGADAWPRLRVRPRSGRPFVIEPGALTPPDDVLDARALVLREDTLIERAEAAAAALDSTLAQAEQLAAQLYAGAQRLRIAEQENVRLAGELAAAVTARDDALRAAAEQRALVSSLEARVAALEAAAGQQAQAVLALSILLPRVEAYLKRLGTLFPSPVTD